MAKKGADEDSGLPDGWKVPFWQAPVKGDQLALHDGGSLAEVTRQGYLQKRAGTSRFRWNVRYFKLEEGKLMWFRPDFKDQCKQPQVPRIMRNDAQPKPVKVMDLTKLKSVVKTRVKFPYSTRLMLVFDPRYTTYQLEIRSEHEVDILEWYKRFSRFTVESYEVEQAEEDDRETDVGGDDSDSEDVEVSEAAGPSSR